MYVLSEGRGQRIILPESRKITPTPPGVTLRAPGFDKEIGECKDEARFWITIGQDPSTSGRTSTYNYPDANSGNNIAGQTMGILLYVLGRVRHWNKQEMGE